MITLLGERYRLGERLAAGGMGSVYRAVDESLGRPVAVKVLRRELAGEPACLERFRREARAAAALSHPGVAGVYDYGELGGQPFIVMELVEGETLAERIAARGRLPWTEAFALGEQVARALAAAHAHRLVHRDVKSGNILVGPGERFPSASAMADALATTVERASHPPAPVPDGPHPPTPVLGPPVREGSPSAGSGEPVVHSPRRPGQRGRPGRPGWPGWRWGRSS